MTVYVVTYDLMQAGQKWEELAEYLENRYPTHWHIMQSTWIITADEDSQTIVNGIESIIDNNDKVFVCELAGHNAAWSQQTHKEGGDWLLSVLL